VLHNSVEGVKSQETFLEVIESEYEASLLMESRSRFQRP